MKTDYSYSELKQMTEDALLSYLPDESEYTEIIRESAEYSLTGGGKRIRPVLLLASCQMCGGDVKKALPFAVALEYIHNYSLIHDDLPALDNDDYRRGRESCHKKFGEDIAILTGDRLLTAAFHIMADAVKADPKAEYASAMEVIATCANDMISGQTADIKCTDIDKKKYGFIARNKTAALMMAAMLAGAYAAGAGTEELYAVRNAGLNFGLAFQVCDDILDAEKDENVNYARLFGRAEAAEYLEELKKTCLLSLSCFDNKDTVAEIIGSLKA